MMIKQQTMETQTAEAMAGPDVKSLFAPRNLLFALSLIASVIVYWAPLKELARLSFGNQEYSYIGMMPPLVIFLFYSERKKIFQEVNYLLGVGAILLAVACGVNVLSGSMTDPEYYLWLKILSLIIVWAALIACLWGVRTLRAAAFPMLFVVLMLPFPAAITEKPLEAIRHGSAEVVNALLIVTQVPFLRDGMRFAVPGVEIEIAPECSGIHSTLALLIGSLLVAHFYLRSWIRRALLVLSVFPIVSLTNGFRIYGLTMLSAYVNRSFLSGDLHRKGGVIFFCLGLFLLGTVARLLRKPPAGASKVGRA